LALNSNTSPLQSRLGWMSPAIYDAADIAPMAMGNIKPQTPIAAG
jgi:hypothetical protein